MKNRCISHLSRHRQSPVQNMHHQFRRHHPAHPAHPAFASDCALSAAPFVETLIATLMLRGATMWNKIGTSTPSSAKASGYLICYFFARILYLLPLLDAASSCGLRLHSRLRQVFLSASSSSQVAL